MNQEGYARSVVFRVAVLFWVMGMIATDSVVGEDKNDNVVVTGELKQWHRITLTFDGPETDELATPTPFTDYRLNVTFSKGNETYVVPGFYATDGDAANTSATAGNKWRVHFAPSMTGTWTYTVSFRQGLGVAVSDNVTAGRSGGYMDGETGTFDVDPTDKTGRDNRSRGLLQYVGEHHLQWAETGKYFLKQGADSPETLLGYRDFDGPFKNDGHHDSQIKDYATHIKDWKAGDPTWAGGKGKGLIGGINYLASEGMNAISFLTMNINGDGRNSFPYLDYNERMRIDCSRLNQWEIVFDHADRNGFYLHFKTQEAENETLLDKGDVGPQRKLYYRELIARFGHHLALNWNLGEENGTWGPGSDFTVEKGTAQNTAQRIAMSEYFWNNDPYQHHIVIHNGTDPSDLLGHVSKLTGVSLQASLKSLIREIKKFKEKSAKAGRPWVVAIDEPAGKVCQPDHLDPEHNTLRQLGLWGTVMAGGAGNEWFFGYGSTGDLECQDFRTRDLWWDQCRYQLEFFSDNNIPFHEMAEMSELTPSKDDYVFAKEGVVYCIYVPYGGETKIKLPDGTWQVEWFDPRRGGSLKSTNVKSVKGPGTQKLGIAPDNPEKDWVILVSLKGGKIGGTGVDVGQGVAAESKDHILNPRPGKVFVEKDGFVVIEAESVELPDKWVFKDAIASHTGRGYIQWEGGEFFRTHLAPMEAPGVITYSFKVNNPGIYRVMWRTRQYPDVERNDADNDMYFRIVSGEDDDKDRGPDLSIFSKAGTQSKDEWSWRSWVLPGENGGTGNVMRKFDAGIHHIQISGRSERYPIDRFVISNVDVRDFSTYYPDIDESKDSDANFLMRLPESEVEVLSQHDVLYKQTRRCAVR